LDESTADILDHFHGYLCGTYVLGYAPCFLLGYGAASDEVQQGGFPVVDMT